MGKYRKEHASVAKTCGNFVTFWVIGSFGPSYLSIKILLHSFVGKDLHLSFFFTVTIFDSQFVVLFINQ